MNALISNGNSDHGIFSISQNAKNHTQVKEIELGGVQ